MKVLIVCSGNSGYISPFILDQAKSLKNAGVSIDYFTIKGKGLIGYIKNLFPLIKKIKSFNPNLIHAHYGLSGLLASLQRIVPVITTFHGSDINIKKNLLFSYLASKMSRISIFVHPNQPSRLKYKEKVNIIACGVDLDTFYPMKKESARNELSFEDEHFYGLFSSQFVNEVKNYPLAQKAIVLLQKKVELIELKNKTREEVNLLMNGIDFLLVTSFSETGPLVVKEAMACNTPIVSTDVGDVRDVIGNTDGCYLPTDDPVDISESINKALLYGRKTTGRDRIKLLGLDVDTVAQKIIKIYEEL